VNSLEYLRRFEMRRSLAITRRRFMAGLSSAGFAACLPSWGAKSAEASVFRRGALIKILVERERESCREYGLEMDRDAIDSITYAVETIAPSSHNELALAINWSRGMRFKPLIDEYARRRSGKDPQLPYHPIFKLEKYAMPETFGIPAYREQIESLFKELFDIGSVSCRELYYKLLQSSIPGKSERFDMKVFLDLLSERQRKSLSLGEADTIYEALQTYACSTTTYISCSVGADKIYTEMKKA